MYLAFAELSSVTLNLEIFNESDHSDGRLLKIQESVECALAAYVDWARRTETNMREHVNDLEMALEQIVAWFESSIEDRPRESVSERGSLSQLAARDSWAASDRDSWPAVDAGTALSRRLPPALQPRRSDPPEPAHGDHEPAPRRSRSPARSDTWAELAGAYVRGCRCGVAILRGASSATGTAGDSDVDAAAWSGVTAAAAETLRRLQADAEAGRAELAAARANMAALQRQVEEMSRCRHAPRPSDQDVVTRPASSRPRPNDQDAWRVPGGDAWRVPGGDGWRVLVLAARRGV